MITSPDILIIGAGPGGSIAAISLARAGYAVTLVDRAAFPRQKVCGGCLSPAAVQVLSSLNLPLALRDATVIDTCTIRVNSSVAQLPATGYRAISRETFDHTLTQYAVAAGVELLPGCSARVQLDHSMVLESAATGTTEVRPRFILIADGISGTSLSLLPEFAWKVSPSSRMGVSTLLARSPVSLGPSEISMLCHRDGYLGLVRLPGGEIDAAAALSPTAARTAGGPATLCARILASCAPSEEGETLLQTADFRGTPLLTRERNSIESGNIFLIGDAAAYVEPFTGEGMTWSMQSALAASSLIGSALETPNPAIARGTWTTAHHQLLSAQHRRCRLVTRFVRHDSLLAASLTLMNQFPPLSRFASQLLGPRPQQEGRFA